MSRIKEANDLLRSGDYVGAARIYAQLRNGDGPIQRVANSNLYTMRRRAEADSDIALIRLLDSIDHPELEGNHGEKILTTGPNSIKKIDPGIDSSEVLINEELTQEIKAEISHLKSFGVNWSRYFNVNDHEKKSLDAATDYVLTWRSSRPLVDDWFDTAYYLDAHPDIKKAGINPLIHYLEHGRSEGRNAVFLSRNVLRVDQRFKSGRKSIVVVSHESSATGAPLLGLNIARKFSEEYNIISIVLKKKDVQAEFDEISAVSYFDVGGDLVNNVFYFLKSERLKTEIKAVLVNSIVGYPAIHAAHSLNLPTVLLIHEFTEYMRPHGTCMSAALLSDVVVVPAKVIEDSVMREFEIYRSHSGRIPSIFVRHQGKLPYLPGVYGVDIRRQSIYQELKKFTLAGGKLVIGAGYTQMRKGVDLFVSVARYVKQLYEGPCKFVWVGDGFDPSRDLAYSVYLEYEIRHIGLGDDFVYIDHVQSLDPLFDISDVFCLPSRMDPFPNVIIDALTHDLHVACFEGGTGAAEFMKAHAANSTIVGMSDTYAMAQGIANYLRLNRKNTGVNAALAKSQLDFDAYMDFLRDKIDYAVQRREESTAIADYLLKSNSFDPAFFGGVDYAAGPLDDSRKIRIYVDNALKGIIDRSPRPGFSNIAWVNGGGCAREYPQVPLFEALKANINSTHDVCIMNAPCEQMPWPNEPYLVHLHVHYEDLLPIFSRYFRNLGGTFDLCVTYNDELKRAAIEKECRLVGAREVILKRVENMGRDVLPMIQVLMDAMDPYDIIGHFHTKGSKGLGGQFAEKWRDFILNTLIGDSKHANKVLASFSDERLGLIFSEDSYNVGVTKNESLLRNLQMQLGLEQNVGSMVFPIGNMFWARRSAITGLCKINIDKESIKEPLPHDGTILHAIERIIPQLAIESGYKVKTIHRPGVYR